MKILVTQLCLFLLLAAAGPVVSDECLAPPDNIPYSVDLLEGVVPRVPYPQEQSPSPSSYAYLIDSDSKGYVIVNQSLASRINKLSCATQEIAVSVNVILLSEGLQPLVQIANPNHDLEGEMLLIAIDATTGTLILSYHHQGSPHVMHLPFEVPIKNWHHFVFVFSHNQFILVQDCTIIMVESIPTPDLCLPESVTVSVGEVTYSNEVHILQGALQNVMLIFGNGGYSTVCPKLDTSCGTCAEVLQLNQRIAALEKERDDLQLQVDDLQGIMAASSGLFFQNFAFFEDFRVHPFVTNILSRSPLLSGVGDDKYNCIIQEQRYSTGEFFFHSFDQTLMDVCCMCFFGKMICKGNVQRDKEDIVTACSADLPLNTVITTKEQRGSVARCSVKECGNITDRGPFELDKSCQSSSFDANVCGYEMNPDRDKRLQYHAAVCCSECDPCNNNNCPVGIECVTDFTHGNHSCLCPEGQRFDGKQCIDVDECMNRTICPMDSTCVNKVNEVPGYVCNCTVSGYRWNSTTNECLDIDECKEGSASCPDKKVCENTEGGFTCNCMSGFKENAVTGDCEVQCTPECQNGGTCSTGNKCVCPAGFNGSVCEKDIDECKDGKMCADTQECVNTAGSYVCRCKSGYRSNGTACEDIDECAHSSLHHCDRGVCENTPGSYWCKCNTGKYINNCTGVCRVQGKDYLHSETYSKTCKLCVCMHGLSVCTPEACDCSDHNTANSQCCREQCLSCTLRDGSMLARGTQGTTRDGCTTCNCKSNGGLKCFNLTCPNIDYCPEDLRTTPDGVCCPTCKVPICNKQRQSMSVDIDNGCQQCSCDNGKWTCDPPKECPSLSCADEERVYEPGECCPKCRALSQLAGVSCL